MSSTTVGSRGSLYGSLSGSKSFLESLREESDEGEIENREDASLQKTSLHRTMRYNEDTQSFLRGLSPRANDSSPVLDESNRSSTTSPKLASPDPSISSSSRARRRNELTKTSFLKIDSKQEKDDSTKREKSQLSSLDDSDFLKNLKKPEPIGLPSGLRSSDSSPRSSKSPQGRLSPLSPDLVASPRAPVSSFQRKTSREASLSPKDPFSRSSKPEISKTKTYNSTLPKSDSKNTFRSKEDQKDLELSLSPKKESTYESLFGSSSKSETEGPKTRDSTDEFLDSIFGTKEKTEEKSDLSNSILKKSDSPEYPTKKKEKEKEIDPFSLDFDASLSPKSNRKIQDKSPDEARKRAASLGGAGDREKKKNLSPSKSKSLEKGKENKTQDKSKITERDAMIASLLESSDDNADSPSKPVKGDAKTENGAKSDGKKESKAESEGSKKSAAEDKQKTTVVKITAKPASVSSLRHKQLPLTSTIALFQPPPPIADLEPEPGSNIDEWPETDVIRQRAFSAWYEQKKAQNLKTLKVLKEKMAEEKEKEEEKKRNQKASAEQFEQWKKEKDIILQKTWKEKKEKEKEREKEEKMKEKEKEKLSEATFKKWQENKQKQQMEEKKKRKEIEGDSSSYTKKTNSARSRPSSAKGTPGSTSDRNEKKGGRKRSGEKIQTMTPKEAYENWEKKKAQILAEEQKRRKEREKKETEEHQSEKEHRKKESRDKFEEWKQKKKERQQTERATAPVMERPPFRPNSRYKQSSSSALDFYSNKQQITDLSVTMR